MGVFEQGDIVEFDFAPSVGHEPRGRRPGLVVSSFDFNVSTSMTLVCPITTRANYFPLHLDLPELPDADAYGKVALEQVRAYDLDARNPEIVAHVDDGRFMGDVLSILRSFYD